MSSIDAESATGYPEKSVMTRAHMPVHLLQHGLFRCHLGQTAQRQINAHTVQTIQNRVKINWIQIVLNEPMRIGASNNALQRRAEMILCWQRRTVHVIQCFGNLFAHVAQSREPLKSASRQTTMHQKMVMKRPFGVILHHTYVC